MKKLIIALLLTAFFTTPASAKTLSIVTTFTVLADITKNVGGNAVNVTTLVGPESDTHIYEPTSEDAKKLASADIIVMNGLGFEPWMPQLVKSSGTKARIVIVGDSLKTRVLKTVQGTPDPHAWQNIANGRIYASTIAAALELALPDQAKPTRIRAAAYDATLNQMDSYIRQQLATIPRTQRTLITSHEAFTYFGAAYGVTFMSPTGLTTAVAPYGSVIATLILKIKKEAIKTIFAENGINPKLVENIAAETGARVTGPLYSDALSTATGIAPTYLAMFRNNIAMMKPAMQAYKP